MLWHSISSSRFSPMQIVSKHSVLSKPVLRPFCLETIVYSPLPFFFFLLLSQSSARSAETFSMYNSFSYGYFLFRRRARAQRGKRFNTYKRKTFQYTGIINSYIETFSMYFLFRKRLRAAWKCFQT